MARRFRGITENQEQNQSTLVRDVRPLSQKISDFFKRSENAALVILFLVLLAFLQPAGANLVLLMICFIYVFARLQKTHLPFRMPMRTMELDYGDKKPNGKYGLAKGIYYFGNDITDGSEMWFSDDDMRTHCLIFGSTGSGKTVALAGIAFNALVQSSGFIYIDGKGDNSLFSKLFSMVKFMGREDDLLLINFMTGARDIIGAQESRLSNTMNPFASGSSSMLSNLVSSMLDSGGSGGDGDMWKGRAIAFVESLFKILVYQRDAGNIMLDADSIRNYFSLDRLEAMVADKVFIRDGQFDISLEGVPDLVMQPISNYLTTLPGYVKERKGKQVSQVFEQHGYITMQLTRTFTTFADTYGHIMRTKLAEVDLKDVVLNRRILVVLLPALEKSPDELANLGKIVIASLRAMMASGLGDAVEGTYQDVITRKPTNSPTPYLCIMDEYGYYAVKGFAVVPAQARSLGFSCIFAGQDLPAFQKASKEEAASIGANTNIKICMKLEDPTDTWEFFQKSAGEAYVTAAESFSAQNQGMSGAYFDTKSAKAEKRSRIDLLDLKDQGVGQAHVFFKSQIIRANLVFFDPPAVKSMRLNVFTKVDLPKDETLYKLVKSIEDIEALLVDGKFPVPKIMEDSSLDSLITTVNEQMKLESNPIDVGLNVLFEQHRQSLLTQNATEEEVVVEPVQNQDSGSLSVKDKVENMDSVRVDQSAEPEVLTNTQMSSITGNQASINVFEPARQTDQMPKGEATINNYGTPMFNRAEIERSWVYIGKLMAKDNITDASNEAKKAVSDLETVTRYEDIGVPQSVTKSELINKIKALTVLFNE